MPTICCIKTGRTGGLKESGSITRIPMERDVLYQALLLRIWQKDFLWRTSVERAKEYISGALEAMLDLGKGNGPMNHGFYLKGKFVEEERK